MKLGEIVSEVSIDPGKFRDYALDPNNPVGRHKALVFQPGWIVEPKVEGCARLVTLYVRK